MIGNSVFKEPDGDNDAYFLLVKDGVNAEWIGTEMDTLMNSVIHTVCDTHSLWYNEINKSLFHKNASS